MSERDDHERCPYGIGSDHWPGVGKSIEEMGELGLVFGKLFGSGGNVDHWSGDLLDMMRDEIADVRASLLFLTTANPALSENGGESYMRKRLLWKHSLFQAWHRGAPKDKWPRPEDFGLPKIDGR